MQPKVANAEGARHCARHCVMGKRKKHAMQGRSGRRQGTAWPRATGPVLGAVESTVLSALLALRVELGREPEPREIAERVGLRDVRSHLERLAELGFDRPLSPQQEACLDALGVLAERLGGRSPTTHEVSEQMGLRPSASRYHINRLVAMGLVTPPERRLVLSLTPHGWAHRRQSKRGAA